jgi:lysyl-tRNA synthetase class 2
MVRKWALICYSMPLHFYLIEAEMTQQNAQSTSEQTLSENDLITASCQVKANPRDCQTNGKSPWPNTFKREHYAGDLQEQFKDQDKAQIEGAEKFM